MKKQITIALGLAALLSHAAQSGQEQLATSVRQAREEATTTSAQLNSTVDALNSLVGQKKGDLTPAYQAYRAEIPRTQNAARVTKDRLDVMARDRDTYFRNWQNTINGIKNESLQKKAQKRLNSASRSYDEVEASLKSASEKFNPLLSDLTDIDKALSQDVTAAGVKSMRTVARSANWNCKSVSNAINDSIKEMGKLEKALSAQAD